MDKITYTLDKLLIIVEKELEYLLKINICLKENGQKICALKECNSLSRELMKEVLKITKKKEKDSFDG